MAPRVDPVRSDEVLPARADVVIIGGGIIGASTALSRAVGPFLQKNCQSCHNTGLPSGSVDMQQLLANLLRRYGHQFDEATGVTRL